MTHRKHNFSRAPLLAALVGALALSGCSRDEVTTAPEMDAIGAESGDVSDGFSVVKPGLLVTTADPQQYYVKYHKDRWFSWSTVSEAPYFDLIVRNESRRTARNLELLVTVPGDLDPAGWYVLIDGHYFSSLEDFPDTDLRRSFYPPIPHFVYRPQGNARFYRLQGPETLAPGEEWVVPVEASRGLSEIFKLHFVAASQNRLWSSPREDVTVRPPASNGGGGGE